MPGPCDLKDILRSNAHADDFSTLLAALFSRRDEMRVVFRMNIQQPELLEFLDIIDNALGSPFMNPKLHKKCVLALRKICGSVGVLPTSHMLGDGLQKMDDHPLTGGAYADVWRGTYNKKKVAIKSFRIYASGDLVHVKKRFCKEAIIWKRLDHPNLLPFLGASTTLFPLCMVSEWMENGTICDYLKADLNANRLALLTDVARGIDYLHSTTGCVHGDLKGANILINGEFRACIADFGLLSVTSDPNATNASTNATASLGSTRWMCPELMNPEEYGLARTNPTKESDIYSLGMVIYEVFSGAPPFNGLRDATVIHRVLSGLRPEKLHGADVLGFSDRLWELTELCWREKWQERPVIATIFKLLEEEANNWVPPTPVLNQVPDDDNYSYVEAISSDLPGSRDSDQQSDSAFSSGTSEGTGLVQYADVQNEGSESVLHDPSTATVIDGTASSVREMNLSARAMHQGRSLSAGSSGSALPVSLPMQEPMEAVKKWLDHQAEIMQARAGRRLTPGVVLDAEPIYIDAQDSQYESEIESDIDKFVSEWQ